MQLLYKTFGKFCVSTFNGKIYTAEMVYGLNNIINLYCIIGNTKSFSFKNESCLIMRKSGTFDMI